MSKRMVGGAVAGAMLQIGLRVALLRFSTLNEREQFDMKSIVMMAAALVMAAPVSAQPAQGRSERIVSLYRAAPGHQLALLKWMAQQDAASKAAGVGPSQLYVHQEGASWDFFLIQPVTTPAQDKAVDAELTRMGAIAGPKASLEFRQHIAEHSDTFAAGPTTAADWLKQIGE
jgi:hypothetical protein